MMTLAQALAFARSSASAAHDQRDAYEDSVASYRDNIRDTLNDEHSAEHEAAAWSLYDSEVTRLFKGESA